MRIAIKFFAISFFCIMHFLICGIYEANSGWFDWFPWYSYDYRKEYACRAMGGREGWDCAYDILLNTDQKNIGLLTRGRILMEVTDELVVTYKLMWQDCHWGGVKNFYRDGCGFGWYNTDRQVWPRTSLIIPTQDPLLYPWLSTSFTSYARSVFSLLIRVDQSNINESFISSELKKIASKWDVPAVVCLFLKGSSQPPVLVGCVPDNINPYPPVFNEVAVSGMRASVILPRYTDQQSKWYRDTGNSTFEKPAVVLHYYDGSESLSLVSDSDLLQTSQYDKCFGGKNFSDDFNFVRYYGVVHASRPHEICAYHTKCPPDEKDIEEYRIGCVPRPGVLDNSRYLPVIDFALICDNLESNDKKPQYGVFNTQDGFCRDSRGNQMNSLKPRRAVMLAFLDGIGINTVIGKDNSNREIVVGSDYTLHLKNEKEKKSCSWNVFGFF